MGNKEFNQHFCMKLCKMGFLVFSLEYRLCPEATVFQQLDDIFAALAYIEGMLPLLRAETNQCYVVGDSAGAMLAMYAAAIQRNPKLAKAAVVQPSSLEIRAMALISGMFYTIRKDSIGLLLPKGFLWRALQEASVLSLPESRTSGSGQLLAPLPAAYQQVR